MATCSDCSTSTFEPSTLVDLLRWRAIDRPHDLAYTYLVDGETEELNLTYGELDQQARAIAVLLQKIGATGERVLLLYPQGLEYVAAFFGCLYAGAVAVPTYPPRLNQSLARINSIVSNAQPLMALTTDSVMANIESLFTHDTELKKLRRRSTSKIASSQADQWQAPAAISGDTLAFLQYTSGSTSVPKGVMVSHANLLYNHRMLQSSLNHPVPFTYVSWLPLFHDMGLIANALQAVYVGVPCILMSPMAFLQKPFRWLQAISRYKAHTSGGPNFAYELCVRKITPEQRSALDLSSWRLAFNGAEPVRPETMERFSTAFESCGFRREAFYPCYGLAEATVMVSGGIKEALPIVLHLDGLALERNRVSVSTDDEGARTYVGCGRSCLDEKIVIVNPETLTLCSADEVGEIWVSGSHVAQGYWNRPAETQCSFRGFLTETGEGPFLRTGDLGFLRDGELFITGRLKDLIIIDGSNHYPQDIELTLEQSHPSVRAGGCAAFSVDVEGEERLVILAEIDPRHRLEQSTSAVTHGGRPDDRAPLTPGTIIKAIRRKVAENHDLYTHAVSLLKRGGVPKTSSGKIQRRASRDGFLAGTLRLWEPGK